MMYTQFMLHNLERIMMKFHVKVVDYIQKGNKKLCTSYNVVMVTCSVACNEPVVYQLNITHTDTHLCSYEKIDSIKNLYKNCTLKIWCNFSHTMLWRE